MSHDPDETTVGAMIHSNSAKVAASIIDNKT
jgi:hypothetical protein